MAEGEPPEPDAASICQRDAGSRGNPGGFGALPPEPRGADQRAAQDMSSRKPLLTDPPREKSGPQLPQGHRRAPPSPSPTDAWGQPRPQSSSQQAPETQDWVSEREAGLGHPRAPLQEPQALALEVGWSGARGRMGLKAPGHSGAGTGGPEYRLSSQEPCVGTRLHV